MKISKQNIVWCNAFGNESIFFYLKFLVSDYECYEVKFISYIIAMRETVTSLL